MQGRIGYKLCFALLGFAALITEIATIAERGVFSAGNFFSYFTIQSNILVVISLLISMLFLAAGHHSKRLDVFRMAVTVYILVVGIGFAVLLSGLDGVAFTAVPLDNIILHYVIPAAVLIDLLIDRPRTRPSLKTSVLWLLYPLLYVVYSLIRGTATGWYPYPFLNPWTNGYQGIVMTVVGLLLLGIMFIIIVRFVAKKQNV